MADDGVGYCKPPVHSRWQPGQSGNSKGRPKQKTTQLANQINELMEAKTTYRERGKTKTARWRELSLRMLVDRAANGDVGAAEDILKIRLRAERQGGGKARVLMIENWLPDHPDQTPEEKEKAVRDARHAEPT